MHTFQTRDNQQKLIAMCSYCSALAANCVCVCVHSAWNGSWCNQGEKLSSVMPAGAEEM